MKWRRDPQQDREEKWVLTFRHGGAYVTRRSHSEQWGVWAKISHPLIPVCEATIHYQRRPGDHGSSSSDFLGTLEEAQMEAETLLAGLAQWVHMQLPAVERDPPSAAASCPLEGTSSS